MRLLLILRRLLALTRGTRLDRELDDEVRAHLELAERDALAAGLSPDEARRRARLSFGAIEQMKEAHRDRRAVRWIDTFVRDARYGLASLRRDPVFALIAIAVLALGIGGNAAMFSIVDGLLLKPLPFPQPDRIVWVYEAPTPSSRNGVTSPNYLDWKRLSRSFVALSAIRPLTFSLTGSGEPKRVPGLLVNAGYFEIHASSAAIGRTFVPSDEEPGAARVVVISHAAWLGTFGADPGILQRQIVLDGQPHDVVGVLPAGAFDRAEAAIWKPLIFGPDARARDVHWLSVVGRLRDNVSLAQAQDEMRAIATELRELQPAWKRDWSVAVDPLDRDLVTPAMRRSLYVAFGAVFFVLLIACANLANLLLAKSAARSREMAVRAALGATRTRLVGQVLIETLMLCLLGGLAGLALAYILIQSALPFLPSSVPVDIRLDRRVLAFAGLAAGLVSLAIGILPALQIRSRGITPALGRGSRGSSLPRERLRRGIVVAEVAASLVLLCAAALLFKSLARLNAVDGGVRVENVLTMSAGLPTPAYRTPERMTGLFEQLSARLRAIPGVEQAALATGLPFSGVREGMPLRMPGRDGGVHMRYKRVDPHYFPTLEIPVLRGRNFEERDRAGAPPVIALNELLDARMREEFGLDDLLHRTVRVPGPNNTFTDMEVVAIIRNERVRDPGAPWQEVAYVPLAQVPRREIKLVVRTTADAASMFPSVRAAVRDLDPAVPLGDVRTMAQVKRASLSNRTDTAWIIGAFASVAVVLTALGLYGVLAHGVHQQRREIGIRMALGARAADVMTHLGRSAVWMIAIGISIGLAGAALVTRLLTTLLFEVSPVDPVAFAIACVAMMAVGLAASVVPAQRAATVDPVRVLRDE